MLSYKFSLKFSTLAYNITILLFILFMAILKPKSIQDVLASTPVVTPPTPVKTTSPTASINQAQLAANKAKAAEKIITPAVLKQADPNAVEWSTEFYKSRGFDSVSAGNLAKDYQTKMANTTSAIDDPTVTWTPEFSSYLEDTLNRYENTSGRKVNRDDYNIMYGINPKKPLVSNNKLDTFWDLNDTKTPKKVNVGKYVSEVQWALTDSKWDRTAFNNSINYDSLDEDKKKRADNLFAKFDTARKAKMTPADTLVDTSKGLFKTSYDRVTTDETAAEWVIKDNKAIADEFFTEQNTAEESAFNNFQTAQNDLLKGYEGNRLNQVQWDLRRALLSRWVDVSKIPQEQLIALSGQIGAQAFSDISAAKERAVNAIETARQNKLAKVQALKAQKVLSDQQAKSAVADINSKSAALKTDIAMKEANFLFGINEWVRVETKADKQKALETGLQLLQWLGAQNTDFKLLTPYLSGKTPNDVQSAILKDLNNAESELTKILTSRADDATKAAQFANELKKYEAETDRIKANKTWSSTWKTDTDPVTWTPPAPKQL